MAILGENISQEDLNLKFLRSLPSKWNTHVVIWRNKPDLDTLSFDDLYNNFKIVEQEVKRVVTTSSSTGSQNMAFVSTPGSTNEVNTDNVQVSTANKPVSTASTHDNTTNLNGLEEMDLKWQLALLSMRAIRYYQKTGKKITINGSDTASYDKSKVECFNCHKMGHFSRECRSPKNQESRPRNQDSSRKTVNVEETSSKAMIAIDGAGFDWRVMADEEVPTNLALMDFLDSEFNKSEFDLATYKRGLAFVEEQLVFYKKNEVIKCVGFASYNAVAPPPTGLFSPPTIDLSNSGLEEFEQPEFEGYGVKVSNSDEDESEVMVSDNVQHKPEQVNQPRKVSQNPMNHRTNRNTLKTQKLGVGAARQSSSRAATPVSAARPINTAAPKSFVNIAKTRPNAFQKSHLLFRRPFYQVTSAVGEQGINVVKSSACWIWRPKRNAIDHISKDSGSYTPKRFDYGDPQVALKDTRIFDSGCTRHMTGNKSYLTDYKDYDGGFMAFAGSSLGGKITGKGKIRTGKLDFEDVYFVKEL
ncbi:ribonuclease H-like domain-containing protein, partial [Tanacetum coccineum]